MLYRFLDPKNDLAFKRIFGTERHKDILIHFLNDILGQTDGIKIINVSFLSPTQDPEVLAKKQSIVDVLCTDQNGKKYIIEMQVARTSGFESRAQYYAAKAYSSQMGKGGKYEDLKEIIFIAILDYELFPKKTDYKSNHTIRDDITNERNLNGLRFIFIELPRFNKKLEELSTIIEKWCYFFKNASETTREELTQLAKDNPIIEKAYEVLETCSWSDNDLFLYEQETKSEMDAQAILRQCRIEGIAEGEAKGKAEGEKIGIKKGIKEGIKEGLKEGKKIGVEKEKIEIARSMKKLGIAIDIIKKATGLDAKDIENI